MDTWGVKRFSRSFNYTFHRQGAAFHPWERFMTKFPEQEFPTLTFEFLNSLSPGRSHADSYESTMWLFLLLKAENVQTREHQTLSRWDNLQPHQQQSVHTLLMVSVKFATKKKRRLQKLRVCSDIHCDPWPCRGHTAALTQTDFQQHTINEHADFQGNKQKSLVVGKAGKHFPHHLTFNKLIMQKYFTLVQFSGSAWCTQAVH